MFDNPLDAMSVRVLGVLVEKEATTPDVYPLTLNAITGACNQTSNRDPVMSVDENTVIRAIDDLTRRALVREVHRADSRAKRWRHLMDETLKLHAAEIAVLSVLMLRGPQTVGEIRTRTNRLFEFRDLAHVDVTLQTLMTLTTPLVAQLPRQPGQKEVRFAHLLSGEPEVSSPSPPPSPSPKHDDRVELLEQDVAALRSEMADLRAQFDEFRKQFQ